MKKKLTGESSRKRHIDIQILNVEMKKECIAVLVAILSSGKRIVQVRTFKLTTPTTPTFVERALYLYQNWLKLVPSCRHFSSIIIRLIICIRHVAYPGHLSFTLASIILICLIVTLVVVRHYSQLYYSLTLNTFTLTTTILTHWGQSKLPSILRVIHQ